MNEIDQAVVEWQSSRNSALAERVVDSLRPMVHKMAWRFADALSPREDLESEGVLGVLRAMERFDPQRGTAFSTFAYYAIDGAIRQYKRDRGAIVTTSAWFQDHRRRVRRAARTLSAQLDRRATDEEVAREIPLPESQVGRVREGVQVLPLSASLSLDDSKASLDRMELQEALRRLKPLWRDVITDYYLLGLSLREVSQRRGICYKYASIILRSAREQLRRIYAEFDVERRALSV